MIKNTFTLYSKDKKGFIETKVYTKSKLPKGIKNYDIVRLTCVNSKNKTFIDCFITPEEASLIASALMRAWVVCVYKGQQNLRPR